MKFHGENDLYLAQLLFLIPADGFHIEDGPIGQLLELILAPFTLILRYFLILFRRTNIIQAILTESTDNNLALLYPFFYQTDHFLPALVGEGRDGQANDIAIAERIKIEIGFLNALDDSGDSGLIPGLDGNQPGFRHRDIGQLV